MKEKIDWYQEVLELEPGSKVFFPLARLLAESGQLEKAAQTLRQGLERHPEFMEARLYFIDLLFRTGQSESCQRQVRHIAPLLTKYAGFWQAWGHTLSMTDEDSDASLAAAFLAASFQQGGLTLAKVLERGLRGVIADSRTTSQGTIPHVSVRTPLKTVHIAKTAPPPSIGRVVDTEDDSNEDVEERFSLRTRSMADILAQQGDYAGALEIYHELLTQASSADEAADLNYRISTLTSQIGAPEQTLPEHVATPVAKHKVLSVLEALAERLEARVHG